MSASLTGPVDHMTRLGKKAEQTIFHPPHRATLLRRTSRCLLFVLLLAHASARAQQPRASARHEQAVKQLDQTPPQVLAVIHRLYGLRLAWWMAQQSGAPVLLLSKEPSHANIVAGRVLDDGQTVVARLPNARAEKLALPPIVGGSAVRASDFLVVRPDGAQFHAALIGVDEETGLSLLKTEEPIFAVPPMRHRKLSASPSPASHTVVIRRANRATPKEPEETARQSPAPPASSAQTDSETDRSPSSSRSEQDERVTPLRQAIKSQSNDQNAATPVDLLAPTQVQSDARRLRPLFGATKGRLCEVERSGEVVVRAEQLTPAFAGAVAMSADGRWLGIVERIEQNEARVIPRWRVEKIAEELRVKRAASAAESKTPSADGRFVLPREERMTNETPPPRSEQHPDALGIQGLVLEPTVAARFGLVERGLLVLEVAPDAAADRAGIRAGDYIETLDGEPLTLENWTAKLLRPTETEVRLGIRRGAKRIEISLRKGLRR